ncbi:hypothetical protein BMT54_11510 [Pasteurellaceae bacterium 15-036681]|nr:hypothetical protein BMT54_11510 [Pasteurellaceae bacterium 15-036681]
MENFESFNGYDLSHLNAFHHVFSQQATDKKPEKLYHCIIEFSSHCFTKSLNKNKQESLADYPIHTHYITEREQRIFCPIRYNLSLKLPTILRNLDKQKCFFTSADDKFLTVSIQNSNGEIVDYEIYFSLKRATRKNSDVHIFINSAYVRSEKIEQKKIRRKAISLFVLLHNTLHNKRIKQFK